MASQHPDIEKVLFTQEDIDGIVSRLGEEITRDYAGKDLVLIAVLRGAVVFMGDLMRKIELPTNIDFMAVSSRSSMRRRHIPTLHTRAHHVTPIAHKIAAGAADGIHQHQAHRDHAERLHNGSLTLSK